MKAKALPPAEIHRSLASLLARQLRRYRKRLKVCQREFSEKAVHDLRVSIRRLLSTLDLLGNLAAGRRAKKARRALKGQLDTFGELRDTQVQLRRLAGFSRTSTVARAFRASLLEQERQCIRRARKRVKRLRAGRIAALVTEVEHTLQRRQRRRGPARDVKTLLRCVRDAFTRTAEFRSTITAEDTDTIHCTRVAFKKFRYMVEALAPVLPEIDRQRLRAMRAYQNLMGDIQDATVLLASAKRFVETSVRSDEGLQFETQLQQRRDRLIARYLRAADRLCEFAPLAPARKKRLKP